MSKLKRFLIVYFVVYTLGGFAAMWAWGPPDFSAAYREQYGHDHERYRAIAGNEHYRLYKENPAMHPLEGHLAEEAAFAETYTARPEFQLERRRIDAYVAFFDYYNTVAVIILAWGAGWAPLRGFLDKKIAQHAERIENARQERLAAEAGLDEANRLAAALPGELADIEAQGATIAAAAIAEAEEATAAIMQHLDDEVADRRAAVERRAQLAIRRELLDRALEQVEEELIAHLTPERQAALIRRFVNGLENAS